MNVSKDYCPVSYTHLDVYKRQDEVFKFEHPYPEIAVTPEIRQEGYEKFVTTADHLMHITGIAKDQNGTKYYICLLYTSATLSVLTTMRRK